MEEVLKLENSEKMILALCAEIGRDDNLDLKSQEGNDRFRMLF